MVKKGGFVFGLFSSIVKLHIQFVVSAIVSSMLVALTLVGMKKDRYFADDIFKYIFECKLSYKLKSCFQWS